MSYRLENKVVLITGGSIGIGFSCVQELLRHGIKGVTIASSNETRGQRALKSLEEEFGPNRAIFVRTDVTKPDELENAFKVTIDAWKTLDVVINNAGVMRDAEWEKEIDINCSAVVRGTLLGLKYMRRDRGGGGGAIVNVSSALGLMPYAGCPIYVGTKHFVIGFTRSLGTPFHFGRSGVRAMALCPSLTNTQMIAEAVQHTLPELAIDVGEQLSSDFDNVTLQKSKWVAKGLITMLETGENGSCWICENNESAYDIDVPFYRTMRKKSSL